MAPLPEPLVFAVAMALELLLDISAIDELLDDTAIDELLDVSATDELLDGDVVDALLTSLLLEEVARQKSPHKLSAQLGLSINGLRLPCHSCRR